MTVTQRDARYGLWVLFFVNLLNFFDRTLGAALGEPMRKEFGLTDQQLGFLATIFTLAYAVVGLPLGRLADTKNRTRLITVGVTFWSLLTAAGGLVWNYGSMVAARIGVGLGEATCAPAGQSLIGDYFPPERRSRALALFMAGLPVGVFAAFLMSGYIAARWGWRSAFFAAGIPGLVVAAMTLRLKEPERGNTEQHVASLPGKVAKPFRTILGVRTLWWIVVSGATFNFYTYAINVFNTSYLMRVHGLGLKEAGTISAFTIGLVGLVGLTVGGIFGDRFHAARKDGRLLLSAGSLMLAAPLAYLALQQRVGNVMMYAAFTALVSALAFVYYANVYSAIQDVVEPRLRGAAVATYFFAMYVFGASFGPVIVGTVSDRMAQGAMRDAGATVMTEAFKADGLHSAMYLIPVVLLATGLVLAAGSRTVAGDMERMQQRLRAAQP